LNLNSDSITLPGVQIKAAADLIVPEARAMVGTEVSRRTGPVIRREFQRWAAAVGDRNPLYFDPEYARAHGYRDVIAPPLFLPVAVLGVVDLETLRPDGVPEGFIGAIPLPHTPRLMAGGDAYEFSRPAYDGDEVTAVRTVASIEQKAGRSGPFVVLVTRTRFLRGAGEELATMSETVLARP
jgi:acyl dehydratase